MTVMQYEDQNFHHMHLSVLPPAFPKPSPRARLRSKWALKGRERWEKIFRMGGGVEYGIVKEIK